LFWLSDCYRGAVGRVFDGRVQKPVLAYDEKKVACLCDLLERRIEFLRETSRRLQGMCAIIRFENDDPAGWLSDYR